MNLFRRNNQDVQLGDVGQRINLIAQIYSQRSPAQQKKRDIRAQKRGHLHQSRRRQLFPRQPQVPQQRRGGIARSSAQPTARRNRFLQPQFHPSADSQFAPQRIHRAIHKIFLHRFGGERLVAFDGQRNSVAAGRAQPQFVVQRDSLKNGS